MAAKTALLLPGMMCDARMWRAQAESLPIPVVVPAVQHVDNVADTASAILAAAPDEFALAGLSMGGIIAFEIWRQAPGRVTHLALLDTNPHADAPDRQSMRVEQIEQVLAGNLRELAIDSLKPKYLAAENRDDDGLLDEILAMAMDLGPEVFRQQSLLLKNRPDSIATLPTIDCPCIVICGDEDTLCPVSYHELMADLIPAAELQIVTNCGHLSSMEQPEIISQALASLFARDTHTGRSHAI